jgi:cytochrome c biogenesis protein CcmG/thiol:disulfide interchange protein DsbE
MQLRQQSILYIVILLAGLVWIGLSTDRTGSSTAGKIPAPQKGFLAPDFTLETIDGNAVQLSDLRGQAVLLNLWASWCSPCRKEMPAMQRIYEKYQGQDFTILAVNVTYQDNLIDAQNFIQELGLTLPILLDQQGSVARQYQLHSLPTSFFIGKDGIIKEIVVGGPMSEALLESRIQDLLEE